MSAAEQCEMIRSRESWPNKPLVLTAPATTEEPAISQVRRHTGEPFGSRDGRQVATTVTERPQRPTARGVGPETGRDLGGAEPP